MNILKYLKEKILNCHIFVDEKSASISMKSPSNCIADIFEETKQENHRKRVINRIFDGNRELLKRIYPKLLS